MGRGTGMRTRRRLAVALVLVACAGTACGGGGRPSAHTDPPVVAAAGECAQLAAVPNGSGRQLRGMWIATVANLDWPVNPGESAATEQAQYQRLLDTAVAMRLNAVFVQV